MEKEVKMLNLDDILPNRFQPRIKFDQKAILELAESIKKHGVIQPIVVRQISDKYEIIAGERRYKASLLAGKTSIPAIITSLDDKNSAEIALIENVQRENLTSIEEAISYRKILDMGYMNQTELAEKLGKTQSTVANKLRLLNLEEEVQEALMENQISERHARSLLKVQGKDQIQTLHKIVNERLTVRATDKAINELLSNKKDEEIEILDFDDTEGEEKMNNQFNIPDSPIIDDVLEQPVPVQQSVNQIPEVVEDIPVYNENPTLPGFMDVDKIVSNATDIYTVKPETNMNDLLKSDVEPLSVTPVPEVVPAPVPEQPKNKFFGMFNLVGNEEKDPNFVDNIESKETNMDFGIPASTDFNAFGVTNEAPDVFNQTTAQNTNQETITNNSESTYSASPIVPPIEVQVPVETVPFSTPEYVTPQYSMPENITQVVPENPVMPQPMVEQQPVPTPFVVPSYEPIIQPNVSPSVVPESVAPTFVPPVVPSVPLVEPDYNFNFDDDDTVSTPSVYALTDEDTFAVPTEPIPTSNMTVAINSVRDCARAIERFGFAVDTEELDFEGTYEITIKIHKK